jgi:hypothetical protein
MVIFFVFAMYNSYNEVLQQLDNIKIKRKNKSGTFDDIRMYWITKKTA